mgnify:CR=1 FL=1
MRTTIVFALLACASSAAAEDYPSIVADAFANMDSSYRDEWAYSETTTEDDVTVVGRFDPRRSSGDRWMLISVDGRQPTPEEREAYLDDKEEDQGDGHSDSGEASDFVDVNSLTLLEETSQHWLFAFTPDVGDEDASTRKFMAQVSGTLKVAREGPYVEFLELTNPKPIKPAFSVKISQFHTRLTFGPAVEGGPIVPKTMDMQVKGRAAVLVHFEEAESIHYSDYEFAGG